MRGECSSARRLSSALHDRRYALVSLMRIKDKTTKTTTPVDSVQFCSRFPKDRNCLLI